MRVLPKETVSWVRRQICLVFRSSRGSEFARSCLEGEPLRPPVGVKSSLADLLIPVLCPPPAPQSPLLSTSHPQQTPPGPQSSWRAEQAAQDKGQPSRFSSDAEHTIPALSLPAAQLPAQEATKPPSPPPRTGRFHMPRVGRRGSRGGHLMPWAAVRQAQRQETSQRAVWMQEARGGGPSDPRAVKVCERGGWGWGLQVWSLGGHTHQLAGITAGDSRT